MRFQKTESQSYTEVDENLELVHKEGKMDLPKEFGPLEGPQHLLREEAKRAIALFPNDENEAICEVLRRSNSIPDLKRIMVIHAAFTAVAEALGTGRWMTRRG